MHWRTSSSVWEARGKASTLGDEECSEAQFLKEVQKYWKTHCDHHCLEESFSDFLITLGEVPEAVVDTLNHLHEARAMDKRGALPGEKADITAAGNCLRRAVRASTPALPDYVKPKKLREKAHHCANMLWDMKDSGVKVPEHVMEAAKQIVQEGEEVSEKSLLTFRSYWGGLTNSFASTQASTFEMVLGHIILRHYLCSEGDVDAIMRKREKAEQGEEGGKGGRKGGACKGKGDGGKGKGGKSKGASAGSDGKPGHNFVYRLWGQNVRRLASSASAPARVFPIRCSMDERCLRKSARCACGPAGRQGKARPGKARQVKAMHGKAG